MKYLLKNERASKIFITCCSLAFIFMVFLIFSSDDPQLSSDKRFKSKILNKHRENSFFEPDLKCKHDKLMKEVQPIYLYENVPVNLDATISAERNRIAAGSSGSFQPIRFHVDYTNIERWRTHHPEKVDFIVNHLVPTAINYFERVITLYPFPKKIYSPVEECVSATIPERLLFEGVRADFILIIDGSDDYYDTYSAYSAPCAYSRQYFGRPFLGVINYNLPFVSLAPANKWKRLSTTMHELTHLLGFSERLFSSYVDPNGSPWGIDKVVKKSRLRGNSEGMVMILPLVAQVARNHYGCKELEGQEIESLGGSGSRGSHWEARSLKSEILTAVNSPNRVYSNFTLALLESTGWYLPNYEYAQEIYWGKGKGCTFVEKTCEGDLFTEFCYTSDKSGCTFDNIGKSRCERNVEFFDTCFTNEGIDDGDCRYAQNISDKAEVFGEGSRCIVSSISAEPQKQNEAGKCYKHRCISKNNKMTVEFELKDGQRMLCDEPNKKIKAPSPWMGSLVCPSDINAFCKSKSPSTCPHNCWNNGICSSGVCLCNDGFEGDDCFKKKQG